MLAWRAPGSSSFRQPDEPRDGRLAELRQRFARRLAHFVLLVLERLDEGGDRRVGISRQPAERERRFAAHVDVLVREQLDQIVGTTSDFASGPMVPIVQTA